MMVSNASIIKYSLAQTYIKGVFYNARCYKIEPVHLCIFNKSHQGGASLRPKERTMTGRAVVYEHTQRT
jgi:hypothetical protein